jgi:hypothetical protein
MYNSNIRFYVHRSSARAKGWQKSRLLPDLSKGPWPLSTMQAGPDIVANLVAGSGQVQGGCERIVVPPAEAGRLGREREKVVIK